MNSLVVVAVCGLVTLVLGTMAAYGLTRCRPGCGCRSRFLFFLPITLPGLFVGIALSSSLGSTSSSR